MTDTTSWHVDARAPGAAFQRGLSRWNARFLETAMGDRPYPRPRAVAYPSLGLPNHSWPTFVDSTRVQEWGRLAVSLRRLILKAGLSLIPKDERGIADIFGYPIRRAALAARLLASLDDRGMFASRGDFLLSGAGLKCCEYDFGDVGLWNVITFQKMFRHSAAVEEFVSHNGVRVRERDSLHTMVSETLKLVGRAGPVEECNLAMLVPDDTSTELFEESRVEAVYASSLYQAALRALGCDGEIVLARAGGVSVHGGHAFVAGKRIDVVMTQTPTLDAEDEVWATASLLELIERGAVITLNGPDCYTLSNKIVFALLSEAADTGGLDGDDADLVHSVLPWTRRVTASTVKYRGREYWLPEVLVKCKDDFVLKPGAGYASGGVCIGRNTSPSDWGRAVATALEEGTSVVQEAVGGTPMWFLGEDGYPAPHGVNLGIIVCGEEYVGTFIRLMPIASPEEIPIIGYSLGALTGGIIEVED